MTLNNKKIWKNENFQTIVVIGITIVVVFGFWFGSQYILNTEIPPALAVISGSMCVPQDGGCNGWTHPFDRTLHIGDIIVIQGVDPAELKADYPNSDIIVFHRPGNPSELIVHRIVMKEEINGELFFYTKGDGNNPPDTWPAIPEPYQYDPWYNYNTSIPQGAVSQDMIVGKVIMRIPWIGHISIFMHDVLGVDNSFLGRAVILILIAILVIVEFILPAIRGRNKNKNKKPLAS